MIYTLFIFIVIPCAYTSSSTETLEEEAILISAPVGDRVILSCGTLENDYRIYEWLENGKPLEIAENNLTMHSNGSLDFRLRMDYADKILICQSYNSYPNGSLDSFLNYVYIFAPIVKAFLAKTVHNTTVDWGTVYRFPCIFGGTDPRDDVMILNGEVVTEMEHNITEDSVVECKVQNNLSTVHDVAYINVRLDSKTLAIKHGVSDRHSYCQSYSSVMPKSFVCYSFIENIANEYKEPYLISRSRIYSSEPSNHAIENLFDGWDRLLLSSILKYSSQPVVNFSDSNSSDFSSTRSNIVMDIVDASSASWRCVNWAKHLTCATSYPRCAPLGPESLHGIGYIEYPVCMEHCLAVTSLFCFSSLNMSNNSALNGMFHENESLSTYQFIKTGWSELLSVPEARNQNLPLRFSASIVNGTSIRSFHICSSNDSYVSSFTKGTCTRLPLERKFPTNSRGGSKKSDDTQSFNCISGNGENYKGPATMPGCVPWGNLVVNDENVQNVHSSIWPGIYGLSRFTFPRSLDHIAVSSPVCRNPSGLASKPFCLGRKGRENNYMESYMTFKFNSSEEWFLIFCHKIPQCSDMNRNGGNHSLIASSGSNGNSKIMKTDLQVTVGCSVAGVAFCLSIIGFVVWFLKYCNQKKSSNSDIIFAQLNFDQSCIGEEGTSNHDKDNKKGVFPKRSYGSRGIVEEKYLERRRQSLRRRRRLRQLNPCFQCIFGLYYRFISFIQSSVIRSQSHSVCTVTHPSYDNKLLSIRNTATTNLTHDNFLSRLCSCFCLPRFHKQVKNESVKMAQSILTYPANERDVIDEEFEANTLGMQRDKSVVYVTNASMIISPSNTIEAMSNICVTCGVSGSILSDSCSSHNYQVNQKKNLYRNSPNPSHNVTTHSKSVSLSKCDDPDTECFQALSLVESSVQSLSSGSVEFGAAILPEKLFNMASMTHLLHPKLKSLCYPRSRLIELRHLAKRAFGWIILVRAPNLSQLVQKRRFLDVTTSRKLDVFSTSSHEEGIGVDGQTTSKDSSDCIAVVKMIQGGSDLRAEANFLREAEILVELQHKNIIQLLGVCIPLEPLSFLIEYMPFGDLNSFLRRSASGSLHSAVNGEISNPHTSASLQSTSGCIKEFNEHYSGKLNTKILTEMMIDACEAMVYLSEAYYVHRDLATRNFLVGRQMTVKLSDFSMCRPIEPNVDFVSAPNECLPIKWLPLESILHGRFHVDTDVWSFGVLLWEIFSFAAEPFVDKSHSEIINILEHGDRLARPSQCPESIYQLMHRCWSTERNERPSFVQIRHCLKEIIEDLKTAEESRELLQTATTN